MHDSEHLRRPRRDASPKPRARTPRGVRLGLGAILLLGLGLRIAYLAEIRGEPAFAFPAYDAAFHDYWARAIVTGDWSKPEHFSDPEIRSAPYFRPPAYPFALAAVYAILGESYLAPRVAQMLLGLLNVLLGYLLGRAVFDRTVGLVCAAGMTCYWAFLYFEGELLAPVLLVTLALATALAAVRWHARRTWGRGLAPGLAPGLVTGLAIGLFALGRPNALVLALVLPAWAVWVARRSGEPRPWRAAPWVPLGTLLAVAPATVRNLVVAGDFVLITSNGGVNLYIGNNERADCVTADIPILGELTSLTGWTCFDQPAIARGVEELTGESLSASRVSRFFAARALEYVGSHPGRTLALTLRKAALFWGPAEISNNKEIQVARGESAVLRWLPRFPLVLSLAFVGALLALRDARRAGDTRRFELTVLLLAVVGAYFASHLPFFIAGRYRVPLVPFLLLFAAYGGCRLAELARDRRTGLPWVATWLGALVLASLPLADYEPDRALWHFDRGDAYRKQGEHERAVAEFRKAIELATWPDPRVHNDLGGELFQMKRIPEAIASFEEAARLKPDYLEAHRNAATAYLTLQDGEGARPHLEEVVRRDPHDADALYNLGTVLLNQGKPQDAIPYLRAAVAERPDHGHSHSTLAKALLRTGAEDDALRELEEAVRVAPELVEPQLFLARLWLQRGRGDRAAALLRSVLALQPGNPEATELLRQAGQ